MASVKDIQNLDQKIDELRKRGRTDTDIVDTLAKGDIQFASSIEKARALGKNDRDLLNKTSKQFAGKMPTVPSVPLKEQGSAENVPDIQTIVPPKPTLGENVKDFSVGFGKGYLDTVRDTSESSNKLQGFLSNVRPQGTNAITPTNIALKGLSTLQKEIRVIASPVPHLLLGSVADISPLFSKAEEKLGLKKDELTTPSNQAQKYGSWTEKIAEFFVPVSLSAKTKVAKGLVSNLAEKETANMAKKVEDVIRGVTQGKIKDVDSAVNAISSVDTKGIKTYSELKSALNRNADFLTKSVDNVLEKDNTIHLLDDLAKVDNVGGKPVSFNYVDEALGQLSELYTKIKDPVALERVRQITEKAKLGGLTTKEINDIAREYGREFGQKAFSKSGDPLTSVNAQAYENVRKGVKETAREILDDPILQATDKKISETIRTSELISKIEEQVNKLQQKIQKRSLGQNIGRGIEKLLNLSTFGASRGFVQALLPSGQGLKVMNALDLEKVLSKRLSEITDIVEKSDKLKNSAIIELLKKITR